MKRRVLNAKRNKKALRSVLSSLHARPPFTILVDASFIRFASECAVDDINEFVRSPFAGEKCRIFCNGSTSGAIEQWVSLRKEAPAASAAPTDEPKSKKQKTESSAAAASPKPSDAKHAKGDKKGDKKGTKGGKKSDDAKKVDPKGEHVVSRETATRALNFLRTCEPWHMTEGDKKRSERKAIGDLLDSWSQPMFVATQSFEMRQMIVAYPHVRTLKMSSKPNQCQIEKVADPRVVAAAAAAAAAAEKAAAEKAAAAAAASAVASTAETKAAGGDASGAEKAPVVVKEIKKSPKMVPKPAPRVQQVSEKDRAFMTKLGNESGSSKAKATILKAVKKSAFETGGRIGRGPQRQPREQAPVAEGQADVATSAGKRKGAKKTKGVNPLSMKKKKKRETFVAA